MSLGVHMDNENQAKAETSSATAGETQTAVSETPSETTGTAPETKTTPTEKTTEQPSGTSAVGVEGYEKMLADAYAQSAEKAKENREANFRTAVEQDRIDSGAQAESATEAGATETTQAQAAETTEETPATETTSEAAVPPGNAETTEEEPKSDKRIRLKGLKDGHLVEAANEIARAEGISFTEAWERVTPKKPGATETKPATETTSETTDAGAKALRTREQIEADIKRVKSEKTAAAENLDTGKMCEADEQLETLRSELGEVDQAEAQAAEAVEAEEQTKFAGKVKESRADAIKDWPEAGDENSDLSKEMIRLADEYEKDPRLAHHVASADSPYFFADLAAKNLGLLPVRLRKQKPAAATTETKPSTSTAATKPAPVNQRAVGRPTQPAASPASGAARTTQGGGKDDAMGLDKIH